MRAGLATASGIGYTLPRPVAPRRALVSHPLESSPLAAPEPVPAGPLEVGAAPAGRAGIRLSVVIPTYNEVKNVDEIVRRLSALLDAALGDAYELIVVDDDSPDETWRKALGLVPLYPRLRVVRRVGERGLSSAVIRGWQIALGDVLGVIDADLQHPPEVIVKLWAEVEGGADLAVASRNIEGGGVSDWSATRRVPRFNNRRSSAWTTWCPPRPKSKLPSTASATISCALRRIASSIPRLGQTITDFSQPIKTAGVDNRNGQFNDWDYPMGVVLAGMLAIADVTGGSVFRDGSPCPAGPVRHQCEIYPAIPTATAPPVAAGRGQRCAESSPRSRSSRAIRHASTVLPIPNIVRDQETDRVELQAPSAAGRTGRG